VCYRPGGLHLGGVSNLVALPCDDRESQGVLWDKQTCAAHGKLAVMGQRVETLRKENKKEVLAYFTING
jgi:hypothetical protein